MKLDAVQPLVKASYDLSYENLSFSSSSEFEMSDLSGVSFLAISTKNTFLVILVFLSLAEIGSCICFWKIVFKDKSLMFTAVVVSF